MKYKIVADSSSDLNDGYIKDENVGFKVVPLSINIGAKEFIDDENLNIEEMLDAMEKYSGKSTSSCPAPGTYMQAFEGAENVFCVTISQKLSGSFNSAVTAASQMANAKIHVIDSKGASGILILIVDELLRLAKLDLGFEEMAKRIDAYVEDIYLLFVLNKFDNLVKNGRMSRIVSLIAMALFIKPLCTGVDGEIKIIEKPRTLRAAYKRIVENIRQKVTDIKKRVCIITYCQDKDSALEIEKLIKSEYDFKEVRVVPMRGLCSFYALAKGIIVSF